MTDEESGSHLAVEHLAELGPRGIAHVDGGQGAYAAPRRAGYVKAIEEAGLARRARVLSGDFTEDAGVPAAEQLLPGRAADGASRRTTSCPRADRPRSSRTASDPRDVSVVGYDNTLMAALNHIQLTTINQPRLEMGREALQLVLERGRRADEGRPRLYQPELGRARRRRTAMTGPGAASAVACLAACAVLAAWVRRARRGGPTAGHARHRGDRRVVPEVATGAATGPGPRSPSRTRCPVRGASRSAAARRAVRVDRRLDLAVLAVLAARAAWSGSAVRGGASRSSGPPGRRPADPHRDGSPRRVLVR